MMISKGNESKQTMLHRPSKTLNELEQSSWLEETNSKEETIQLVFTINQSIAFGDESNKNLLGYSISNPNITKRLRTTQYVATNNLLEQYF